MSAMNITFECPSCHQAVRTEFAPEDPALTCSHCSQQIAIPRGAIQDRRVTRCLTCPSTDLYVRKDFPQKVGVALVAIGIVGSSIFWASHQIYLAFTVLFVTALLDLVLYLLVSNALMCYRCHAQYRGTAEMDSHGQFDLETYERYRQMAARTQSAAGKGVPSARGVPLRDDAGARPEHEVPLGQV